MSHMPNIVVHLQISVVHTLTVTMWYSIYKLLKVSPGFIFRESSLVNLYMHGQHKQEYSASEMMDSFLPEWHFWNAVQNLQA